MTGDRLFRTEAGATAVRRAYQRVIDTHLTFTQPRTLATSVGETFVLSAGPVDGAPVLLLPGSGSVAASWGPELAELGRSQRVHAIDLPGESGLSAPVRLPPQQGAHAHWLHEVATALQTEPAAVVGVSLGGWVAVDYAISHPQAVRELVLLSPSGIGRHKIAPLILATLLAVLGDRGRKRALNYLLGPGNRHGPIRSTATSARWHSRRFATSVPELNLFRPSPTTSFARYRPRSPWCSASGTACFAEDRQSNG